jgi:AraC-like DNA-binding protein
MKEMLFNVHDIVLFISIYICLIFALPLLLVRQENRCVNIWLGAFLLIQAAISIDILALYGEALHAWTLQYIPSLFVFLEAAFWIEGPLLLWYTRCVLYRNLGYSRQDLLLFVPLALFVVAVIVALVSDYNPQQLRNSTKFLLFLQADSVITLYEYPRNFIRVAFGLWAYWEVVKYRRALRQGYSNLEQLNYSWLKILIIGFVITRLWATSYTLVESLLNFSVWYKSWFPGYRVNYDALGIMSNYAQLIMVTILLFFGLSHSRIMTGVEKARLEELNEAKEDKRSNYTDEQVQRLHKYMQESKAYLNSQLKIDDLAQSISMPQKLLSNLINREFKKNFFEYVNEFRIEEAKRQLTAAEYKNKSVLDIALDSGFNSKSSFYDLFKKSLGTTPSGFRDRSQG